MDRTAKSRMQRYREKKRNDSVTEVTVSVTEGRETVTPVDNPLRSNVTVEHPIMKWVIPGERRKKLEMIVQSLTKFNQLANVNLGCGRCALPLDVVGELLEVTNAVK